MTTTPNEGRAAVSRSGEIEAEPSVPDSTGDGFTDNDVALTNGHRAPKHPTFTNHLN